MADDLLVGDEDDKFWQDLQPVNWQQRFYDEMAAAS